uniref:C-type lectin domain-containing protein n=1 Tax=Haplochromis burtoni TaxID=8153 RepID=A0A3Q2VDM1_HAPBU
SLIIIILLKTTMFLLLNEILCSNIFKDEPCSKCGEGWEHHGGKCYYFSVSKSSWTVSRGECRSKGGDLVKIDSREEQKFLDQRLKDIMNYPQDKFWFGLTDSAEEGRWLWVDGSLLDKRNMPNMPDYQYSPACKCK